VNAQTNALRYNASNGCGITGSTANGNTISCAESRARISKLQIAATGTDGRAINMSGVTQFYDDLICEGRYTGTAATVGIITFNNAGTTTLRNSLIIQRATGADHIIGAGTGVANCYNCTIVAPDDLATAPASIFLSGTPAVITVQNCGLFAGDSTKAIKAGTGTYNFTTCHSDISGTTGVTQVTYGNQFQNVNDATRDFRLKSGANMIDSGTTDSTNAANDIVGTARPSGVSYDTGCWEFIATQSVVPILYMHKTQQMVG
jgi:hypothetical protein